jgi:hypothetical protein
MARTRRLSLRDCLVWVVVIGGHALLLMVLSRIGTHVRFTEPGPEERLLVIELPPPTEELPREPTKPRRPTTRRPLEPPADTAITPPPAGPKDRPPIDWYGEAERAARGAAEADAPRSFDEQPPSLDRKCKKREPSFEWNPEPGRVGVAGGLPFVRLGERCVLGLGFFGCGIGKAPEANGDLFDDMNDPNENTSSVPDPDDC